MPTVSAADGNVDLQCQSTRINNIDKPFLIHDWTLMPVHYGLILISRAKKLENVQLNTREATGFICVLYVWLTMTLKTKVKTRCKIHNTSHREFHYAL